MNEITIRERRRRLAQFLFHGGIVVLILAVVALGLVFLLPGIEEPKRWVPWPLIALIVGALCVNIGRK